MPGLCCCFGGADGPEDLKHLGEQAATPQVKRPAVLGAGAVPEPAIPVTKPPIQTSDIKVKKEGERKKQ